MGVKPFHVMYMISQRVMTLVLLKRRCGWELVSICLLEVDAS